MCHLTIHTIHDSENDHMYIQVGYDQSFYGVSIFFWNFVRYLPEFVAVPPPASRCPAGYTHEIIKNRY